MQSATLRAVLFDRDGTLIENVPYNGDPGAVRSMPAARAALDRLRAAGLPVGVVSNQSGIASGLLTHEQVLRVDERVAELLGPFDDWQRCPHLPTDGCRCRKPRPGMLLAAADRLGVAPHELAMVGDIGADVDAAAAAGAQGILVPTPVTARAEILAAPVVVPDLTTAAELLLASTRPRHRTGAVAR